MNTALNERLQAIDSMIVHEALTEFNHIRDLFKGAHTEQLTSIAIRALIAGGVTSIGDLLKLNRNKLLAIKGIGVNTADYIQSCMFNHGFEFNPNH